MAIIEKVTSGGARRTETVNGRIFIDDANNRVVGMSKTGVVQFLLKIDADDGEPHLYMTKAGYDAEDETTDSSSSSGGSNGSNGSSGSSGSGRGSANVSVEK